MDKKSERLFDATKRLLAANTPEEDIVKSMQEIGLSVLDAQDLIKKVKEKKEEKSEFSSFIGKKHFQPEKKQGFFKSLFKPKKERKKLVDKVPARAKKEVGELFEGPVERKAPQKPAVPQRRIMTQTRKRMFREVLPVRVSDFDKLIDRGGLKRGDTILLSGGCGTGKTTFGMQSLYNGALQGDKVVYLTLEESASKMKENMMENFGWELDKLEDEHKLAIIKIDPLTIARAVEATLVKERGGLYIELDQFELPFKFNLPFKPDRVVFDSLSALSIAFMENEQGYRQYLRHLFETLESYNSVNIVLAETEQNPGIYSRSGIEEFLADGVIVFYNIKIHNMRQRAMEILKLRSSRHVRKITPYTIGPNGIDIFINQEIFSEN